MTIQWHFKKSFFFSSFSICCCPLPLPAVFTCKIHSGRICTTSLQKNQEHRKLRHWKSYQASALRIGTLNSAFNPGILEFILSNNVSDFSRLLPRHSWWSEISDAIESEHTLATARLWFTFGTIKPIRIFGFLLSLLKSISHSGSRPDGTLDRTTGTHHSLLSTEQCQSTEMATEIIYCQRQISAMR